MVSIILLSTHNRFIIVLNDGCRWVVRDFERHDFDNLELPYLDIKDADIFEDPFCEFGDYSKARLFPASVQFWSAMLLIKVRLWITIVRISNFGSIFSYGYLTTLLILRFSISNMLLLPY